MGGGAVIKPGGEPIGGSGAKRSQYKVFGCRIFVDIG